MPKRHTSRHHRAKTLNSLITSNKAKYFKVGKVIDEAVICSWFQIQSPTSSSYADIQRYQLAKLSAYTSLNELLAKRGMRIKAQNYYSSFLVMEHDQIEQQVGRYQGLSASKRAKAITLRRGAAAHHSKWTRLQQSELPL
jgi:hypothetical protein